MKKILIGLFATSLGMICTPLQSNSSSGLGDVSPNSNMHKSEIVSEQINFGGRLIIEGRGDGWWEDQNTAVVICRGPGVCVEIDFDKKTIKIPCLGIDAPFSASVNVNGNNYNGANTNLSNGTYTIDIN